jgi:hypothetical protein
VVNLSTWCSWINLIVSARSDVVAAASFRYKEFGPFVR